jgi:hypothetical protein
LPEQVTVTANFAHGERQSESLEWGARALSEEEGAVFREGVRIRIPAGSQLVSVEVVLKNPGVLLPWHPGAGGETFIFVDEVSITAR